MTASPDDELVPVEQRLAEIHDRYGPEHPLVSRQRCGLVCSAEDDLHTICTCSASFLHRRELRC
jgi:hypothetical protein